MRTQCSLQPVESTDFNWSKGIGELCAKLCSWIYTPSAPLPEPTEFEESLDDLESEWIYKRITPSASTQITQWALLQHNKLPKHLYLIWKGSDPEKIFGTALFLQNFRTQCHLCKTDTIADTGGKHL